MHVGAASCAAAAGERGGGGVEQGWQRRTWVQMDAHSRRPSSPLALPPPTRHDHPTGAHEFCDGVQHVRDQPPHPALWPALLPGPVGRLALPGALRLPAAVRERWAGEREGGACGTAQGGLRLPAGEQRGRAGGLDAAPRQRSPWQRSLARGRPPGLRPPPLACAPAVLAAGGPQGGCLPAHHGGVHRLGAHVQGGWGPSFGSVSGGGPTSTAGRLVAPRASHPRVPRQEEVCLTFDLLRLCVCRPSYSHQGGYTQAALLYITGPIFLLRFDK